MTTTIENRPPTATPWGQIQDQRETLPGVWWTSTAGHGGYWITKDRAKQVGRVFPSFARRQWFEEDCEWSIVDLALQAEIADDAAIHHAVETVLMTAGWDFCKDRWEPIKKWIYDTGPGNVCLQRYQRFHADHVTKWRRGGLCSILRRDYERKGLTPPPSEHWEVSFSRSGEHKTVIMPYPMKEYWTDEEIAAVEFIPEPLRPEPASVVHFNEADCGGAFDGFTVTSDANPGL